MTDNKAVELAQILKQALVKEALGDPTEMAARRAVDATKSLNRTARVMLNLSTSATHWAMRTRIVAKHVIAASEEMSRTAESLVQTASKSREVAKEVAKTEGKPANVVKIKP